MYTGNFRLPRKTRTFVNDDDVCVSSVRDIKHEAVLVMDSVIGLLSGNIGLHALVDVTNH